MGVSRDALWEVQWHPAGGGRVRRMRLTRLHRRLLLAALVPVVAVLAVPVVLFPLGLQWLYGRVAVAHLAGETRAEHSRLAAQRDEALALAGRAALTTSRARRLAWALQLSGDPWSQGLSATPTADSSDDELLAWLVAGDAALARLGEALEQRTARAPCPLDAVPSGPPVAADRGVVVSPFGWRVSPFTAVEEAHHGVTIAAPLGEPVYAPGGGRVVFAGEMKERRSNEWTRMGNVVVIDHSGGVVSVLAGLAVSAVRGGQQIRRGTQVGIVGQTAWTRVPALYFEVRWPGGGGSRPIDPALVSIGLPVSELEGRLHDPTAGLPADFAGLERLPRRRG